MRRHVADQNIHIGWDLGPFCWQLSSGYLECFPRFSVESSPGSAINPGQKFSIISIIHYFDPSPYFRVFLCLPNINFMHLGHSAYFNTAVTKQDFMKIIGVSSQKLCKIISYYHGDVKQTMVYLIEPSVLILIKWDVTKQDFFLVLWLNHLQLLSKIIGYYHGNRE